jgi:pSer/pThr/pTyr-binding forkhead associated (FHA) protein
MPAQLIALNEGPNILLDKPILLLGRHPECDIQIESRKISRRHCCIAQVEDYLVVRDLGSTNGIRINGVRVLEGKLRGSDELTIGNSRYKVRWDTIGAAAPNAPAPKEERSPRSGRAEVVDDAALESCDEPIPLEDSALAAAIPLKAIPAPAPAKPPPEEDRAEPLVLPDDLELAPVSDIIPPPPQPH